MLTDVKTRLFMTSRQLRLVPMALVLMISPASCSSHGRCANLNLLRLRGGLCCQQALAVERDVRASSWTRRHAVGSATITALCAAAVVATAPPALAKSRDVGYPVQGIDGQPWVDVLSSGQYYILRQGGTEPPNSSPLVSEKRRGVFVCAGCAAPLFDSTQKFDSGTGACSGKSKVALDCVLMKRSCVFAGWPSFAAPRSSAIETLGALGGVLGSEVRCARCGGHLGDMFSDGDRFPGTPAAVTGRRWCIDGAALVFVPSDPEAGPLVGDGLSGRARLIPQPRRG